MKESTVPLGGDTPTDTTLDAQARLSRCRVGRQNSTTRHG